MGRRLSAPGMKASAWREARTSHNTNRLRSVFIASSLPVMVIALVLRVLDCNSVLWESLLCAFSRLRNEIRAVCVCRLAGAHARLSNRFCRRRRNRPEGTIAGRFLFIAGRSQPRHIEAPGRTIWCFMRVITSDVPAAYPSAGHRGLNRATSEAGHSGSLLSTLQLLQHDSDGRLLIDSGELIGPRSMLMQIAIDVGHEIG